MPRRNQPRRSGRSGGKPAHPSPLSGGLGWARTESGPDGEWLVRPVPGVQAAKTYRCPGCDHEIRPGVSHVVAWPADEFGSAADRRHWHSGCWNRRLRRGPPRKRR